MEEEPVGLTMREMLLQSWQRLDDLSDKLDELIDAAGTDRLRIVGAEGRVEAQERMMKVLVAIILMLVSGIVGLAFVVLNNAVKLHGGAIIP